MKNTNIAYWIFTALFSFMMLGSAIPDIFSSPVAVKGMHEGLGYPVYFIPFIGVAKALGVIAVLFARNQRLKEWAYAGLMFDLFGASYSLISSGASLPNWLFMIIPIALGFASYLLYHRRQSAAASTRAQSPAVAGNVAVA
ncbi:MAG TPA: DoxX family protein [Chitinophagaceae bacterium]